MKYDILTLGFPLVEIVRTERGVPFHVTGHFTGPYPSADTCIVLDVAARFGMKCCLLGVCGDDIFGRLVLDRLSRDGVDVSHIRVLEGYPTGVVFVRYEEDGTREYLELNARSAFTQFNADDVLPSAVADATWVHLSGEVITNCLDPIRRQGILKFLNNISASSQVSLDPNFTFDLPDLEEVLRPFVERANLILPSEGEARRMMNTNTDEEACALLANSGKIVALKKGKSGCEIYTADGRLTIPSFDVEEVDPTGCGDAFCAGFLSGMIFGWPLEQVGRFANAAGALQATKVGPMEGAADLEEVREFMEKSGQQ